MLNIILSGCAGRMGKIITDAVSENDAFRIIAGVDTGSSAAHQLDFPVFGSFDELCGSDIPSRADVIIDFSHHTAADAILAFAVKYDKPAVIATTGHTDEEITRIKAAGDKIPVFYTYNMSLGINLLQALVRRAASVLEGFDVEIVEKHHRNKLDAPSGTALMLAKSASEGLPFQPEYVFDRHERRCIRPEREIGIHSVRGGSIVGEHEVIFAGPDEVVTISHSAASRGVFARGALRAAGYICGRPAGVYSMEDVIGEAGI